jgi:hypothetical protein
MKRSMKQNGGVASANADRGGFAIILTLLVLTMMTVLVIGFNAATRTEQMAARNYSYQEQAHNVAMMGVNQAVAMLNTNVTNWSARTQPGRLMTLENGAMPLTSASVPGASGSNVNVNAWVDTNYFIARTTNTSVFAAPVVPVSGGTNRIGGYAFWVDDDGSRINLNAASVQARTNFLPTNARPMVLNRDLFPTINAGDWTAISNRFAALIDPPNATATTNGWGYFFTPRQIVAISNVGPANYGAMMFQIAGGPPNWRPTNSYALGSNGVPAALDAPGGLLSTYGSSGYAGSLNSLTTALDNVAGKFFRGSNYTYYFGAANGFADKYSNNVLRQIIANINDANLPGTDAAFTGANTEDMLVGNNDVGVRVPTPSTLLALRPSLFLNELAVGVAYSTNAPATKVEVQIWLQSELVDPYLTGQGSAYEIVYNIRSLEFTGTYVTNGVPGSFSNPKGITDSTKLDYSGRVTNVGSVSAGQFKVPTDKACVFQWQAGGFDPATGTAGAQPPIPATASNVVISTVKVGLSYAVLRAQTNDSSIRDWAYRGDFPEDGFVFDVVPENKLKAYGYSFGAGADTAPISTFTQSIEKNDPRVRTFGTNEPPAPAWTFSASPSLGLNNAAVNFSSGTGIAGITNDLAVGITSIYDHPSFRGVSATYALGRSNWISSFDLSRIHTGLQWRTLQLRAQAKTEADEDYVPDWALLEAFSVTNATASGSRNFKLNINALPYPASDSMNPAALATAGLSRAGAAASLLSGMTAVNAPLAAIGTNNLGFPAAAGFANAAAAMLVGSNVANMTFTNTWSGRRSANTNYQANLYTLPAEVLEVNGVANFSTDEAANEARAQGIYSGIAVSSQVFTVYAVGFANDKQGVEVAEARLRAQVARDTNSGLFKVIFLEPLIWP